MLNVDSDLISTDFKWFKKSVRVDRANPRRLNSVYFEALKYVFSNQPIDGSGRKSIGRNLARAPVRQTDVRV